MLKTEEAVFATTRKHRMDHIAEAMGKNKAAFRNRCNPNQEQHVLTVDDLRGIVRLTGDVMPIQALAYECGGVFMPLPRKEFPSDSDLMDAIARLGRNFGETMGEIGESVADGEIKIRHTKEVLREVLEDLQDGIEIVGHLYMMAEDREEYPTMEQGWEHLAIESVPR